jgi:predicted AAA+ superfamily ATPase
MINRELKHQLEQMLNHQPAVGLLGPRQVGKTTLARSIADCRPSLYLDLESPLDRAKLSDPLAFFSAYPDTLIVLDEIHRAPELFQTLRGVIDEGRRQGKETGRFLVLGSASLELLQQSSESLAGRIGYLELGPFSSTEIPPTIAEKERLWLRGGFPRSYLASSEESSVLWRQDFIRTYLERDIAQLGPRIPAETLRRFWTMLAYNQGQALNAARIAGSLGVSGMTVGRYLDLLVDLLLVRRLSPWMSNTGKRLVRSPKIYVRDCGLVHALLNIGTQEALLGNPVAGSTWEGLVIENLLTNLPFGANAGFYRTSAGAEIDLVLSLPPNDLWAIEIKRSLAPKPEKGFHIACDDLQPSARFVVYPGEERFPLGPNLTAISLPDMVKELRKHPR